MPAEVTAVEIAERLGIDPKAFRAWLRWLGSAGHPVLIAHQPGAPWAFTPGDAEVLAAAYLARDARTQREAIQPPAKDLTIAPTDTFVPPAAASDDTTGHRIEIEWLGETVSTLADLLRPGLRAVTIGINPAPLSVQIGHYYQGRAGQTFYRRLDSVGLLPPGTSFEDDRLFAAGFGFTDVVKRPTPNAKAVTAEELSHGRSLLETRLEDIEAPLVIFVFKRAATALVGAFDGHGLLPPTRSLFGSRVFVMPGPYEQKAHADHALAELQRHLSEA